MYEEAVLIAHLLKQTKYPDIALSEESDINLLDDLDSPRIRVGHLGIKLEDSRDKRADGYHELENDEILLTSIQFICERKDLVTVRTRIKQGWTNFTPYIEDHNYGSLFFIEASVVGKTSTRIWWQEIIGLQMPRIGGFEIPIK